MPKPFTAPTVHLASLIALAAVMAAGVVVLNRNNLGASRPDAAPGSGRVLEAERSGGEAVDNANAAPETAAGRAVEQAEAGRAGGRVGDPGAEGALPARSQYEMVSLPSRSEPIERWKAQRYFCPADFNRDDAIDDADTQDFLEAFGKREGPYAEFLDLNHDGEVDAADLEVFMRATETPCDPGAVAANRAISC